MSTDDDLVHAAPDSFDALDGVLIQALDLVPQPLWITDPRGHVRWTNQATVDAFGSRRPSHFARFIAPERSNDAREVFARKVMGAQDVTIQKTVLVGLAGRLEAEMISVPLRRDEAIVGFLFVIRAETAGAESAGERLPRPRLTPRQHEVLRLLADGLSTEQIAARLQVTEETTRNHIRLLLQEVGVHSRLAAVVTAFRNGWL
jgi:DNA-binding CsgD family transcriptional regulator